MTLPPRIPLARFREYQSGAGRQYFVAYLGDAKVVLLREPNFKQNPKKPKIVDEWILFVEEGWRSREDSAQARTLVDPLPSPKEPQDERARQNGWRHAARARGARK